MLDFSLTGCFVTLAPKSMNIEQGAEIHVAISIDENLSGILTGSAVKVQLLEEQMTIGVKFLDEHPELKNKLFSHFLVNLANK